MCKLTLFRSGVFQLIGAFVLLSCETWFSYSPFEAQVDEGYRGTTEKNLARINELDVEESKTFKVALLADPHYHFSKLADAVAHINRSNDYAFAIVAGDLTENGLKQEFVLFYERMASLNIPYLTVIGNHDYLANGEQVYSQMYGDFNYSFVFNNVKFVMFDNNTLESKKEPDFEWLAAQLKRENPHDYVIPFSHIPPYDIQMEDHRREFHDLLLETHSLVSIHGHRHDFSIVDVYGDGVQYVTISSPQRRTYAELIISPAGIEVKKIEY